MSAVEQVFQEIDAWRTGKLWGCKAIADEASVSESTIVRWARLPRCPIKTVNGRYFVLRVDLILWMTSKPVIDDAGMADVG